MQVAPGFLTTICTPGGSRVVEAREVIRAPDGDIPAAYKAQRFAAFALSYVISCKCVGIMLLHPCRARAGSP